MQAGWSQIAVYITAIDSHQNEVKEQGNKLPHKCEVRNNYHHMHIMHEYISELWWEFILSVPQVQQVGWPAAIFFLAGIFLISDLLDRGIVKDTGI